VNDDTTRRFARTVRDAFRDWPENCIGITGPVVIKTQAPLWVRIVRAMLRRFG
jgi:hypothetical protein